MASVMQYTRHPGRACEPRTGRRQAAARSSFTIRFCVCRARLENVLLTVLAKKAAECAEHGDKEGLEDAERAIDTIVYKLFDLAMEIEYIEDSLAATRVEKSSRGSCA